MTAIVPRLEIWNDLGCASGARLSTGGIITKWSAGEIVTSEEGEESFVFDMPPYTESSQVISEGQVVRIWWSDTKYEEWLVRRTAKRRSSGGNMEVKCGPVSYRLAEHGVVPEWQVNPQNGKPQLDVGLAKTTLSTVFTTYLVNNTFVNGLLPWLQVGTIPSEIATIEFDFSWSFSTAQAVINGAVSAAQSVLGKPYIWRLIRNGSTSYDITLYSAII